MAHAGGRPKFKINYDKVEAMASVMATQLEIASVLGCDVRTLQRDEEFCRVYKNGQEKGKMSLRRFQYESAKKGNVTMQIWLGKQYLAQRDVIEENHKIENNGILTDLLGALEDAKGKKTNKEKAE